MPGELPGPVSEKARASAQSRIEREDRRRSTDMTFLARGTPMLLVAALSGCSVVNDLDELRQGTATNGTGGESGTPEVDLVVFQRGGTWKLGQPGEGGELFVMNLDGTKLANLTASAQRREGRPALTAGASRVAFEDSATEGICTMASMGGSATCFGAPSSNGWDAMPAWSPDEELLAFVSTRDGTPDIYRMNADGSGVTRLTDDTAADSNPSWSPDGNRVVFASDRDSNGWIKDLYTMNANGTAITRLTHGEGSNDGPAVSPDGGSIVFVSNRDGPHEIYKLAVSGGGVTRLTKGSTDVSGPANGSPAYTHDGKRIIFHSNRDGGTAGTYGIYAMNSDGSAVERLTEGDQNDTHPSPGYGKRVGGFQ